MTAACALGLLLVLEAETTAPRADTVRLARDGQAALSIVFTPSKATPAEQTAARELADYLHKITGAKFPLVEEARHAPQVPAIYLGRTAFARAQGIDWASLGPEESILRTVGQNLLLTGGRPRGTLYAVYIFLEEVLGCRWYTPWCEQVPRRPSCGVPALDLRRQPHFDMRDIYGPPVAGDAQPHGPQWMWWTVRNRLNGPSVGRGTWYRDKYHESPLNPETGGGWILGGAAAHTFDWYIPAKEHFAQHPEWYSMRKGKREPSTSSNGNHLCLTNREVRELMTRKVLEQIAKVPSADAVTVSINDGGYNTICDCPACRAVAAKYGESGLLLEFLNPIADAVKAKHPGKSIITLAYNPTAAPPRGIKPRDNIIIFVGGFPLACRVHTPDIQSDPDLKLIEGWAATGARLWTWDKYNQAFYTFSWLKPLWWHLDQNIKLMKRLGVTGMCPEDEMISMDPVIAELYEMRAWLLAKLAENPDLDVDALMRDFVSGYTGAAGPPLYAYLMLQKKRLRDWPWRLVDYAYVREAQSLFDKAEAAVAGNPELSARVRELRVGLDIATLVFRAQVVRDYLRSGGKLEAYPYKVGVLRDRLLKTLDRMTHPYWTAGGTKWALGAYRPGTAAELARPVVALLAQGPEYAPLPEELARLAPERVIEVPAAVHYSHGADCLVADPQAALGVAYNCAHKRLPFEFAVWDSATMRYLSEGGLVGRPDVKPGAYHLYKGARFVMGRRPYLYLSAAWSPQIHMHTLYDPADPAQLWEPYVSVKFTGLETGPEPTGVFIDRVFLVHVGRVKDVVALGSAAPAPSLHVLGRWPLDGDGLNFAPSVEPQRLPDLQVKGPAWVEGRFGQALAFAAATDVAVVPVSEPLRLAGRSFTLTLWFRTSSPEYGQVLAEQWADARHFWTLRVQNANTLNFQTIDPKTGDYCPLLIGGRRTTPTDGQWHLVLIGYDKERARLFADVDGIEHQEKSLDRLPDIQAPLRLGAGSTGFLRGAIDEVRVYGCALAAPPAADKPPRQ